ncbi:hypothetical protein GWK47_041837 [Chionoecetes opilio]|uniref:Uncharacterized protein n=1 Tax=Chionoecetes opilio TaxID=41210 RepID=A0A8J4Y9E7_CHIOP|nr:hypothetical protein GWK47_041837 [Chionoecetes opilio]
MPSSIGGWKKWISGCFVHQAGRADKFNTDTRTSQCRLQWPHDLTVLFLGDQPVNHHQDLLKERVPFLNYGFYQEVRQKCAFCEEEHPPSTCNISQIIPLGSKDVLKDKRPRFWLGRSVATRTARPSRAQAFEREFERLAPLKLFLSNSPLRLQSLAGRGQWTVSADPKTTVNWTCFWRSVPTRPSTVEADRQGEQVMMAAQETCTSCSRLIVSDRSTVTKKGLYMILKISADLQDGIDKRLWQEKLPIPVHKSCKTDYIRSSTIQKRKRMAMEADDDDGEDTKHVCRSQVPAFNIKTDYILREIHGL